MKNRVKTSISLFILICNYSCYDEPSKRLMSLKEIGSNENNLYMIENLKDDGTAICAPLKEYKSNGEVTSSMNRDGYPIIDLSEKDVNDLRSLKENLVLNEHDNSLVKYELIFWDGDVNPRERGFFDGASSEGVKIMEFAKSICKTSWTLPN